MKTVFRVNSTRKQKLGAEKRFNQNTRHSSFTLRDYLLILFHIGAFKMNRNIAVAAVLASLMFFAPAASAFELSFDWGNIPKCTTGRPGVVPSPSFKLSGVPEGTKKLRFALKDLNVPGFNHGGGSIAYSGGSRVPFGAFKYKSPCPPSGRHNYQWTATALDGANKKLGTAKAKKLYP